MRMTFCSALALALATTVVGAQAQGAPKPTPKKPATTSANPLSDSLRSQWDTVKTYYLKSADEMPEESYDFKPVETVRTFGQIVAHVAGANYDICAAAKGEKSPFSENYFVEHATTKVDIVKAAKDSVAYCDGAFAAATDRNLLSQIPNPFSPSSTTARGSALVDNIGHVNEHYGNLVTYLRIKGLVPPSSQPSGR